MISALMLVVLMAEPTDAWLTLGALTLADSYTTYRGLQQGGRELNPIFDFDKHTPLPEIAAYELATQAGVVFALRYIDRHTRFKIPVMRSQIIMKGAAVTWNLTQVKIRW